METRRPTGTIIFVSSESPEATVTPDVETPGLVLHWAPTITAALTLLPTAADRTVVVTELSFQDGDWRDLVELMRSQGFFLPVVLVTPTSSAGLWWDALDCCIEEILPVPLKASRLYRLIESHAR
jgi:DNA-binding NtrC family response regulator